MDSETHASYQTAYPNAPDEMRNVRPARVHIVEKIGSSCSPFLPLPTHISLLQSVIRGFFQIVEKIIGTTLYVNNTLGELALFDSRIRRLLADLVKTGYVSSWTCGNIRPDQPPGIHCRIFQNRIELADNKIGNLVGIAGGGTGETFNETMIPALAEFVERNAVYFRKEDVARVQHGSFAELEKSGAIHPQVFSFYSDTQRKEEQFPALISEKERIGWIRATELLAGKECLIPAQMGYIFYDLVHPDEPFFWRTTTNGVAAATSFTEAANKAMLEAVERDGLFMYWMNGLSPNRVDLEGITIPEVQEKIALLQSYNFDVYVLDTRTELNIPSFVGILVDKTEPYQISVSAAADLNPVAALTKLVRELSKFPHSPNKFTAEEYIESRKVGKRMTHLDTRCAYWAGKDALEELSFFLSGNKISLSDINVLGQKNDTPESTRAVLVNIFRKHNISWYIVDVTSRMAQKEGLHIVRAVSPQLIPCYFQENMKYLGVARLYTVPAQIGFSNGAHSEKEINQIPHPFL